MITVQNSKYLEVFEEISEYLMSHDVKGNAKGEDGYKGEPIADKEITSLQEMFVYMKDLRKLNPRLTRFPLEEPYFEIDANTRTITVPSTFSKNGVFSVQGDEIAESVYFKIDRYFDHTDLATQSIYIQYVNAKGEKKVSIPPVVDIESEPNCLIIEWPISSSVTAGAGNVQFSVRFFTYDTEALDEAGRGKIVYSLSTLPATIQVKASQDFDLINVEEENGAMKDNNKILMEERITTKSLYGVGKEKAETPEFFIPLEDTMNLGVKDGFTSEPIKAMVEAYSVDGGKLSYVWRAIDLDGNPIEDIKTDTEMIPTEDLVPVQHKAYYLAQTEGDKIVGFKLFSQLEKFEEDKTYYEKVSYAMINQVGRYLVEATNRVGSAAAVAQTPWKEDESTGEILVRSCLVPAAQKPIVSNIKDSEILTFNDVTDNFEAKLSVIASSLEENGAKLTYQWQYSKDGESFVDIEGATDKDFVIGGKSDVLKVVTEDDEIVEVEVTEQEAFETVEDAVDAVATLKSTGNGSLGIDNESGETVIFIPAFEDDFASGDGYYKVIVTNNLNNTTADEVCENMCRVTHSAIKPNIEAKIGQIDEDDNRMRVVAIDALDASKGLQIEASIPDFAHEHRIEEGKVDKITYQWYRYSNSKIGDEKMAQLKEDGLKAAKGKYVVDNDYRVKGATDPTLVLTQSDLEKGTVYFCRVLNTYNGTVAMRCSKFFEITRI